MVEFYILICDIKSKRCLPGHSKPCLFKVQHRVEIHMSFVIIFDSTQYKWIRKIMVNTKQVSCFA